MCGYLTDGDWFASDESFGPFFSLSSANLGLVKRWKMLARLALIVELPLELPVTVLTPPSAVANGRGDGFGGSEVTGKNDTGLFGLPRSMLS